MINIFKQIHGCKLRVRSRCIGGPLREPTRSRFDYVEVDLKCIFGPHDPFTLGPSPRLDAICDNDSLSAVTAAAADWPVRQVGWPWPALRWLEWPRMAAENVWLAVGQNNVDRRRSSPYARHVLQTENTSGTATGSRDGIELHGERPSEHRFSDAMPVLRAKPISIGTCWITMKVKH